MMTKSVSVHSSGMVSCPSQSISGTILDLQLCPWTHYCGRGEKQISFCHTQLSGDYSVYWMCAM